MDGMMIKLVEQFKSLITQEINDIHTVLPAKIISFNNSQGRVSVKPHARLCLSNGKTLDFPIINDVPIYMPCSLTAGAVIAFPVKEGDDCLLLFSEQALDTWLEEGESSSEIRFSLTSAIAIPGIMKRASEEVIEATNDNAVIVKNGNSKIKLTNENIAMSGNVSVNGSLTVNGKVLG